MFFLLPLLENGRENLENEFPNFPFTKSIGKFALNSGSSYWIDLGTDWLNEEEFDDSVEKNILEINSQKLYTQQLRHKLLKQLSYWRRHK